MHLVSVLTLCIINGEVQHALWPVLAVLKPPPPKSVGFTAVINGRICAKVASYQCYLMICR